VRRHLPAGALDRHHDGDKEHLMTPFRWIVAAGCVYELAALHERSP
jgi:hypothetical protein